MKTERIHRVKHEILSSQPEVFDEPVDFIPSGSSMLNLAGSGRIRTGGWARGRIANVVGDGSSGKTLVALEFAALCHYKLKALKSNIFPKVNTLEIVYNNVEGVMDFPVSTMYGDNFFNSVDWIQSQYVEDFGSHFLKKLRELKKGHALVYIIDSWDALDSREEGEAFNKHIDEGTKMEGSFDLGKQKYASKRFFKKLCGEMRGKDCTLMIISQTRVRIGITFGKKKYRAGSDALNFYTHQVCWLYEVKKLAKQALGHQTVYGLRIRAKFERNKVAKPYREAEFAVLFDHGIDNERSMIDWYWGPEKKTLEWDGVKYKRDELVKMFEDNPKEVEDLIDIVEDKWNRIESMMPKKRKKYEG
jgi:recombination protein RecA